MKIMIFIALVPLTMVLSTANAQWQSSGTNIYSTNSGNVGIGTMSPGAKLDVYNDASSTLRLRSANAPYGLNFAAFRLDADGLTGSFQASHLYPSSIRIGSHSAHRLVIFTNDVDRVFFNADGRIGIGTSAPQELLHLEGSIRGDQSGALRVSSGTGYVDVGSKNASWAHFISDRPRFYFNKGITVEGGLIGSHNGDLHLQTAGTTRLAIQNSNGFVGINNAMPINRLDVGGDIRATNGWIKNTGDYGLFNETDSNYFYSDDLNYWRMQSGRGLRIASKNNLIKGYLYHNNADGFGLLDADGQWAIRVERDNYVGFYLNGVKRMHLASGGALGIGIDSPTELLDVNGTARLRTVSQNNGLTRSLVTDSNGKIFWRDASVVVQNFYPQ